MQYCDLCHVYIRGGKERCPLCGNILSNRGRDEGDDVFPYIPLEYQTHLALKIMVFISICAIVTSFAIYMIFPSAVNWPLSVALGMVSMWVSLGTIIQKRHNITKSIMWQVTIISALSVLWDWRTGWRGWSLDYAVPTACTSAMFVIYVLAKIMKAGINEYIVYMLLDGLLGLIPVLFIILGWTNVIYPSVISIAVSIIFISAIFIFQGEYIKDELNKKMHI